MIEHSNSLVKRIEKRNNCKSLSYNKKILPSRNAREGRNVMKRKKTSRKEVAGSWERDLSMIEEETKFSQLLTV